LSENTVPVSIIQLAAQTKSCFFFGMKIDYGNAAANLPTCYPRVSGLTRRFCQKNTVPVCMVQLAAWIRRSGPMKQSSRYQSPATLHGLSKTLCYHLGAVPEAG
jgi:hypothetical protein